MSEKKSFVLYTSYYDMMEDLTLEQKGYLFDCLFRYQMGEAIEINDPLVRIVYKLIRKHFEIDNEKYETKKAKYRENISKRWRQIQNNVESETENKNQIPLNTMEYNGMQSNTKEYQSDSVNVNDNVDVNVNDNVDVNVNNIDKSIYVVDDDKEKINKKERTDVYIADDVFFDEFFSSANQQFVESLAMQTKCSIAQLRNYATEIQAEWRAGKQLEHRDYTDAFHHLRSHLLLKAKISQDKSRAAPEILQTDELTEKQKRIKEKLRWKQQVQ